MLGLHGAILLLAAALWVQPPAPPDRDALLAALDGQDAVGRIEATERLLDTSGVPLRSLEAALLDEPLSAEQRARLLGVVEHRFMLEPRAAIGIRFDTSALPRGAGVVIATVYPNFPSAEVLRPGDRVEAIDGIAIGDTERFRARIVAHDPGETVALDIVRDGRPMTVTVGTGSYSRLPSEPRNGALDPATLRAAWEIRSPPYTARALAEARVIDSGLDPGSWIAPRDPGAIDADQRPGPTPTGLTIGGQARVGAPGDGASLDSARAPAPVPLRAIAPQVPAQLRRDELRNFRASRQAFQDRVDAIDLQLTEPGLPPQVGEQLRAVRQQYLDVIRGIDDRLRALEAQDRRGRP